MGGVAGVGIVEKVRENIVTNLSFSLIRLLFIVSRESLYASPVLLDYWEILSRFGRNRGLSTHGRGGVVN